MGCLFHEFIPDSTEKIDQRVLLYKSETKNKLYNLLNFFTVSLVLFLEVIFDGAFLCIRFLSYPAFQLFEL